MDITATADEMRHAEVVLLSTGDMGDHATSMRIQQALFEQDPMYSREGKKLVTVDIPLCSLVRTQQAIEEYRLRHGAPDVVVTLASAPSSFDFLHTVAEQAGDKYSDDFRKILEQGRDSYQVRIPLTDLMEYQYLFGICGMPVVVS